MREFVPRKSINPEIMGMTTLSGSSPKRVERMAA